MSTIFLALGSNVGARKKNIQDAITLLRKHVVNITVAPLYETTPMYYEKQDNFLNTVLRGETTLSPQALLEFVKKIEQQLGRIKRFRNGPREIDVDILFYDDVVYKDKDLLIPHPHIQERDFVLKPFMDIDPNFIHPIPGKSIRELFENLPQEY